MACGFSPHSPGSFFSSFPLELPSVLAFWHVFSVLLLSPQKMSYRAEIRDGVGGEAVNYLALSLGTR